jgi:hypothetical protein
MEFNILFYRNRPEAYRLFLSSTDDFRNSVSNYVAKDGWTYLRQVCRDGDYSFAELLLEHAHDINNLISYEHNTPFLIALQNNHLRIMELLLNYGYVVNDEQYKLYLETAVQYGCVGIIKYLLDKGIRSDILFIKATFCSDIQVYTTLFDYGIEDTKDGAGFTTLMKLAQSLRSRDKIDDITKEIETIKLFIERGSDVRVRDPYGVDFLTEITFVVFNISKFKVCDATLIQSVLSKLNTQELSSIDLYIILNESIRRDRYDIIFTFMSRFHQINFRYECRTDLLLSCINYEKPEILKLVYYAEDYNNQGYLRPTLINPLFHSITLFEILHIPFNIKNQNF